MTCTKIIYVAAILSLAASGPAFAQMTGGSTHHGSTNTHAALAMSDADMKSMKACHGMSRRKMLKDANCTSMMKSHPEMMKMSRADMNTMMACHKMSGAAMSGNKRCAAVIKMHQNMMQTQ